MSAVKQTILIVDESQENIHVLTAILGAEYEIQCAGDASTAIEIANESRPLLVVMNASLPDSDGFEACARLKSEPRTSSIPVLLLLPSGRGMEVARALEAGAADFIPLPMETEVVQTRTRTHAELKQYRDFLRNTAFLDGLTGVANRRRFDEFLELEWRRNLRNNEPLSLLMIDMDSLKDFNEQYGHAAGDECLKSLASAMDIAVQRPGDFLARYGGGKFACLLPETDNLGAVSVAERIRAEVAALDIPHEISEATSQVTVSVGVATLKPSTNNSHEDLLMLAEQRLLEAKAKGRNRSEFS